MTYLERFAKDLKCCPGVVNDNTQSIKTFTRFSRYASTTNRRSHPITFCSNRVRGFNLFFCVLQFVLRAAARDIQPGIGRRASQQSSSQGASQQLGHDRLNIRRRVGEARFSSFEHIRFRLKQGALSAWCDKVFII